MNGNDDWLVYVMKKLAGASRLLACMFCNMSEICISNLLKLIS